MRTSLLVMALLLSSATVHAQSGDADREEARALFAAGQAAVDAGRWPDALSAFQRAYQLTGVPSALFNAAFALRAMGRFREAEAAFVELLSLEGTRADMRGEAEGYLSEVRAQLATVRLLGLPDASPDLIVRLDAVPVADGGERPLAVQTDPGHRLLDVSLPGFERFEWAGDLLPGEARTLAVELFPLATGGPAPTPGGIETEAWFWVVISVAALGIAGGIVGWYVADEQAQLRPESMMPVRL